MRRESGRPDNRHSQAFARFSRITLFLLSSSCAWFNMLVLLIVRFDIELLLGLDATGVLAKCIQLRQYFGIERVRRALSAQGPISWRTPLISGLSPYF